MFLGAKKKFFLQAFGLFFLILFWAGSVQSAEAAVRINEIAWMGTTASSTHEWIELANDAAIPVTLSGWQIDAVEGSPRITLAGVIGANGYFLIERKTDAAVPDIPADLVASFGTGLSNAGETLELKDASGAVVDTVVGGKDWTNIGGDNVIKQTAQRVEGTNGWVTGTPTPRAPNVHPEVTRRVATTALNQASTPSSGKGTAAKKRATITPQKNISESGTTTVLWRGSGASAFSSGRGTEWMFLFIGIVLSVIAGFIIVRSGRQQEGSPADAYSIVEDIIEGADD